MFIKPCIHGATSMQLCCMQQTAKFHAISMQHFACHNFALWPKMADTSMTVSACGVVVAILLKRSRRNHTKLGIGGCGSGNGLKIGSAFGRTTSWCRSYEWLMSQHIEIFFEWTCQHLMNCLDW